MKNKQQFMIKPTTLVSALVIVSLLLIGVVAGMYHLGKQHAPKEPAKPVVFTPEQLLVEANKLRAEKGVAPLKLDKRLNLSAQFKADDMREYGYFGHENPVLKKMGHDYAVTTTSSDCVYVGENLARIPIGSLPRWQDSKPHYEAVIDQKYDLTGFGYAHFAGNDHYVQHFCDLK